MNSQFRNTVGIATLTLSVLCLSILASPFGFSQETKSTVQRGARLNRRSSAPPAKPARTSTAAEEELRLPSDLTVPSTIEGQKSQETTDLTGRYKALLQFPREQLEAEGQVTVDRDRFKLESGDVTLIGQVTTRRTGDYTAVALKFKGTDGLTRTVSLRLTQDGKKIWLNTVKGEDASFKVALTCPAPPGCMESDLCRPFCK